MVKQDALHALLPQASKFNALFVCGLTRDAKLHQAHGLRVARYPVRIGLGQHGLTGVGPRETKFGLDIHVELQQTAPHKLTANARKAATAGGPSTLHGSRCGKPISPARAFVLYFAWSARVTWRALPANCWN